MTCSRKRDSTTPQVGPDVWCYRWWESGPGGNRVHRRIVLGTAEGPAAQRVGIVTRIGWHTFRRTYSTLLRATGAELKVMQDLMRHSTIRVTLDTYTQAVTTKKRAAQTALVSLFLGKKGSKAT